MFDLVTVCVLRDICCVHELYGSVRS